MIKLQMKKKFLIISLPALAVFVFCCRGGQALAATDAVSLSADVQVALSLDLSSGTYNFGNLTAGTPGFGSGGIIASVTTSASDGYNLGISDGVSSSNSALLHTDTVTRIPDASASIASPGLWVSGTTKGLGVTVFSADTSKESKWGTGTTYNDGNNKYAGVPENVTTIHTSSGYKAGVDTTGLAFVVDVTADQLSGVYSGDVVITATAVLL
jgi:hypothetical protein